MSAHPPASGYFRSGLPYNRIGHGARPLVVVQGLLFENKPQPRYTLGPYAFLRDRYTVFVVLRRPGMPHGYTLADMAADCAATIRQEFGGRWTSSASPPAVRSCNTWRRTIRTSSAASSSTRARTRSAPPPSACSSGSASWRESAAGRRRAGCWWTPSCRRASRAVPAELVVAPIARMMSWSSRSADPSDLIITIAAEDAHDFRDRLAEIAAPTLVIAGADDPFYTEELFRETAAGIPGARLILYPGMGHPAHGKQFARDVLAFLGSEAERAKPAAERRTKVAPAAAGET